MKTEIELTLDSNGRPCLEFNHHYKDNSLEQKVLQLFIDAIKERGMNLISTGIKTRDSSQSYRIQIGNQSDSTYDKAINYVQKSYYKEHLSIPYMLIGDVRELIKITTGKEVDLDILINKK